MPGVVWDVLLGAVVGVLALWALLLVALTACRPRGNTLREALRLLPDLLRLLPRLARDPDVPRAVRIRLWLAVGYLALPIDLVPDFIPVLGHADDAIVVSLVLRSLIKHAGPATLAKHWPGSADGLAAVHRLAGLPGRPVR
jgi:uncharacterized membrane protein YkvA (DUF1232 family)